MKRAHARHRALTDATLLARLALFNNLVGSLFLFECRFFLPSRAALDAFSQAARIVTAATWMAYPLDLLLRMGCGFRTSMVEFVSRLRGARFATVLGRDALREAWKRTGAWRIRTRPSPPSAMLAPKMDGGRTQVVGRGASPRAGRLRCRARSGGGGAYVHRTAFCAYSARSEADRGTHVELLRQARRWDPKTPGAVVGVFLASAQLIAPLPPAELVASALSALLCNGPTAYAEARMRLRAPRRPHKRTICPPPPPVFDTCVVLSRMLERGRLPAAGRTVLLCFAVWA